VKILPEKERKDIEESADVFTFVFSIGCGG